MKEFLFLCVAIIAKIHNKILQLNNAFEVNLSDKELHFLVIGLLGMGMLFVIYPLFKFLASKKHEMVIAWIYVFTVIVVVTFAIEIGQKITGTGNMEFADIMFGLVGFLAMFAAFSVIRMIYHGIRWLIRYWLEHKDDKKKAAEEQNQDSSLW